MLRNFIISQVWDGYTKLPALHKREITEYLGDPFTEQFLNKETRSYDSIDTATLAMWAKAVKGTVPETAPQPPSYMPGMEMPGPEATGAYQTYVQERDAKFPDIGRVNNLYFSMPPEMQKRFQKQHPEIAAYQTWRDGYIAANPSIIPYVTSDESNLSGADPEIAKSVYQYRAFRGQYFPGIFDIQDEYFTLPTAQRRAFKKKHPELEAYWEFQRNFMANNPNTIPYIKSIESIAEGVLGKNYKEKYGVPETPEANYIDPNDLTPALTRQLLGYHYGQPLGSGARREIARLWEKYGRPTETVEGYTQWLMNRMSQ
jgi:hypothetical protein